MTISSDLFNAVLSPSAEHRRGAEAALQAMPLEDRLHGLLQMLLSNDNPPHHQQLAAVLLRRDIIRVVSPQALMGMVDPLLDRFFSSSTSRSQVGHCLAEICGNLTVLSPQDGSDAAVMDHILSKISPSALQGDVASLRLLACIAERAPRIFTRKALPSLPHLMQSAITPSSCNPQLLEAATELLVKVAIASTQQETDQQFSALKASPLAHQDLRVDPHSSAAQLGLACLPIILNESSAWGGHVQEILQHLSEAAYTCPSLFLANLQVFDTLVQVCLSLTYQDASVALSALEVLSSLLSVADVRRKVLASDPILCQKIIAGNAQSQQHRGIIAISADLCVSGVDDDIEAWATDPSSMIDEDLDWEADDLAIHAETLLHSFLYSCGSPALAILLPLVERLLQANSSWKDQRAALSMLESCLIAAPVTFAPHNDVAMKAALAFSTSSNPRVQWQALRLLGVLCEANVRQSYEPQILSAVASALSSSCSKVASLACLTIVSYCRGQNNDSELDAESQLLPYLSDLLHVLVSGPLSLQVAEAPAVNSGAAVVVTRATGAVACLAESAGEAFGHYYSTVMPRLLVCLQLDSNHPAITQLLGAAIEAATIVGQAIGEGPAHEIYIADANKIMQYILPIIQGKSHLQISLDPLLSSSARIASVLGERYAPFATVVMPKLLERATAPPDISVLEGNEGGLESQIEVDEDMGSESMTVAVPGKGMTKVTINTTRMQEKSQALRAICEHASSLKEAFLPYIEGCLEACMPLVTFQFSSEVRLTSAQTLAAVFEAACIVAEISPSDVPKRYLPTLAKTIAQQIHSEGNSDMDVLHGLADSLSDIMYSVHRRIDAMDFSTFSLEDARLVVSLCMQGVMACLERRRNLAHILSGGNGPLTGEDERQEYEDILQQEEALLTPLVDSVGFSLKVFKEAFTPIFCDLVYPVLHPCLKDGKDIRAQVAAVCLFDDCVEHCGSAAADKYSPALVEGVLLGLNNSTNGNDEDLKRASIYGVCQMARKAPSSVLAPHSKSLFHNLMPMVNCAKDEANDIYTYENAVSALASLALIGRAPFADCGYIKRDHMINIFVSSLPLQEDPDEAKICHAGFCDLVEQNHLNPFTEMALVLEVIGETLACVSDGEDIADHATCSRFAQILQKIQREAPSTNMNACFTALSLEAQTAIQDLLAQYSRSHYNVVTP